MEGTGRVEAGEVPLYLDQRRELNRAEDQGMTSKSVICLEKPKKEKKRRARKEEETRFGNVKLKGGKNRQHHMTRAVDVISKRRRKEKVTT